MWILFIFVSPFLSICVCYPLWLISVCMCNCELFLYSEVIGVCVCGILVAIYCDWIVSLHLIGTASFHWCVAVLGHWFASVWDRCCAVACWLLLHPFGHSWWRVFHPIGLVVLATDRMYWEHSCSQFPSRYLEFYNINCFCFAYNSTKDNIIHLFSYLLFWTRNEFGVSIAQPHSY